MRISLSAATSALCVVFCVLAMSRGFLLKSQSFGGGLGWVLLGVVAGGLGFILAVYAWLSSLNKVSHE